MKKTIRCGKIDWNGAGRRVNSVELELELKMENGHWAFRCCGLVWNSRRTGVVAGGQVVDEIFRRGRLSEWEEILGLWSRWHMNDMKAGSPAQEKAVREWMARRRKAGKPYDYGKAYAMLKAKDLLFDKSYVRDGKPYEYGTAWLVEDIPEEDLAKIRKWIGAPGESGRAAAA